MLSLISLSKTIIFFFFISFFNSTCLVLRVKEDFLWEYFEKTEKHSSQECTFILVHQNVLFTFSWNNVIARLQFIGLKLRYRYIYKKDV